MSSKSWWNTQFNYVISRFFFEISLFSILNLFKFYLRISCYKSNGGMMPRCNWFLLSKFYHVFVYNSTIFKLVEFFFLLFRFREHMPTQRKGEKIYSTREIGIKSLSFLGWGWNLYIPLMSRYLSIWWREYWWLE